MFSKFRDSITVHTRVRSLHGPYIAETRSSRDFHSDRYSYNSPLMVPMLSPDLEVRFFRWVICRYDPTYIKSGHTKKCYQTIILEYEYYSQKQTIDFSELYWHMVAP